MSCSKTLQQRLRSLRLERPVKSVNQAPSIYSGTPDDEGGRASGEWPPVSRFSLPTIKDWTEQKFIIENLYLKQNLNLQDVMVLMKERHGFQATTKMYKNQFQKWGWRKYRVGKLPRRLPNDGSERKACLRRPDLRCNALHHENTAAMLINQALFALQDCFQACSERDPDWTAYSKFKSPESLIFNSASPHLSFSEALSSFERGDATAAGIQLRYGFLQTERAIQEVTPVSAFTLFVSPLYSFLAFKRYDLLVIYLSFLGSLSTGQVNSSLLMQTITPLVELCRLDGEQAVQFVAAAFSLYESHLSRRTSALDRVSLLQRANRLSCLSSMGIATEDLGWALRRIIDDFEHLIKEAAVSDTHNEDDIIGMQGDILWAMWRNNMYLDDFVTRTDRIKQALSARYGVRGFDTTAAAWGPGHTNTYLLASIRLVGYFLERGEPKRAFDLLPDVFAFLASNMSSDANKYVLMFDLLESTLREHSRTEEADRLHQLFQNRSRFRSMKTSVKEVEAMSIGVSTTTS